MSLTNGKSGRLEIALASSEETISVDTFSAGRSLIERGLYEYSNDLLRKGDFSDEAIESLMKRIARKWSDGKSSDSPEYRGLIIPVGKRYRQPEFRYSENINPVLLDKWEIVLDTLRSKGYKISETNDFSLPNAKRSGVIGLLFR